MADDLKIIIQAALDESKSAKLIQSQLENIQKNLNISIGIDAKQIQDVTKQLSDLQSKAGTGNKVKVIDDNEASKVREVFSSLDKAIEKYSKLGSINISKNINPANNELEKFVLTLNKADGTVEKLNFELAKLNNIQGSDGYFLKNQQVIDKTSDLREKQLQQEQKIDKEIAEQNQKLQHQLNMYKEQAKINAQNLVRRFDGKFDQTSLNAYLDNVDKLNTRTPHLRQEMDKLGLAFRKISSEVRSANSHSVGFLEQMGVAFQRFPIWVFTASAIYGPLRALQDMTRQIIEIDTALTNLARVTDMDNAGLNAFLQEGIDLSNELSNRLTDVLKIAEEFSRMGFEENELLDITKQAQMLQNISDLDAQAAVDTLTSAMLNFNIAAEDSVRITDALNEVDNNFAISTRDLSDGIRKSASTAKTFGKLYAA